jgi:hypothetical protein
MVSVPAFPFILPLGAGLSLGSLFLGIIPGNSFRLQRIDLFRVRGRTPGAYLGFRRGFNSALGRSFRRILDFLFGRPFRRVMPGFRMGRYHYPWLRLFHCPRSRGGGCGRSLFLDHDDLPAFPGVFRARPPGI